MSTIEAAAENAHDAHGQHHDHDHPSFLAHHFDTPEQQFDSGKLGIWLFLVTEILFFSGMFCAYAIFRMLRPDVFEGCSQFLNTKLGAINTGVLLFSSLTMAWAVRCSQVKQDRGLVGMLAATLSCAMIFLGVKAIEYSHKWEMGLLPAGMFFYDPANPHPESHTNYLFYICLPFMILLGGVVIWLLTSLVTKNRFHIQCAMPLTVAAACFFVGIGLGMVLESGDSEHVSDSHHSEVDHLAGNSPQVTMNNSGDTEVLERLAADATNSGAKSELTARQRQFETAGTTIVQEGDDIAGAIVSVEENVMTKRKAGVFFSIYYCMTGVHAIHILVGIGFLVWLLVRAVRKDFNPQYFGPVYYVGLYWHLVDLIWIYLFPLLYLIR